MITLERVFKVFGLMIGMYDYCEGNMTDTVRENAIKLSDDTLGNFYQDSQEIGASIMSLISQQKASPSRLRILIKSQLDNYILTDVKTYLNSESTSVTNVLNDLVTDMGYPISSGSVLTSGKFDQFFQDIYSVNLITDSTPTISDNLIDVM